MEYLRVAEKVEIILIYGDCRRSVVGTMSLHVERFSNKATLWRASLYHVVKTFTKNGNLTKDFENKIMFRLSIRENTNFPCLMHNI